MLQDRIKMDLMDAVPLMIAQALQSYVCAEPDHRHGLCSWLDSLPEDFYQFYGVTLSGRLLGRLYNFHAYDFMDTVRAIPGCPEFESSFYVSQEPGCTPKRLELAQFIIDMLASGKLVPVMHDANSLQSWKYVE